MKIQMPVFAIVVLLFAFFAQPAGASDNAAAFTALDVDGDGFLTIEEAEPNADLVDEFEDGDENNDGKIDMAEFEKLEISEE